MITSWIYRSGRDRPHILLLMTIITGVSSLKDVSVTVPQAASVGDTVTLQCRFNLEEEPLYTLKWYKGSREFFRYIPKEHPNTQVFPFQDINVDLSKSTKYAVVLRNLRPEHTGRYKCEVSTDAPNFYTKMEEGYMYVINVPKGKPEMYIEKDVLEIGYTLRGNCTSPPSFPAFNLTWYLNGRRVNASYVTHAIDPYSEVIGNKRPQVTVAGLDLEIDSNTFQGGKAHVRCMAELFGLYEAQEELIFDEERPKPRPSSVLGNRESTAGGKPLEFNHLLCTIISIVTLITR